MANVKKKYIFSLLSLSYGYILLKGFQKTILYAKIRAVEISLHSKVNLIEFSGANSIENFQQIWQIDMDLLFSRK